MMRSDFNIGACSEVGVKKHFEIDSDRIVIFYPEIYWSKYEPKQIAYEKACVFNYLPAAKVLLVLKICIFIDDIRFRGNTVEFILKMLSIHSLQFGCFTGIWYCGRLGNILSRKFNTSCGPSNQKKCCHQIHSISSRRSLLQC